MSSSRATARRHARSSGRLQQLVGALLGWHWIAAYMQRIGQASNAKFYPPLRFAHGAGCASAQPQAVRRSFGA
jgi:hypothetical protein